MTTHELLKAARAKIAAPWNWTQGAVARTESGRTEEPDRKAADCWCAIGALRAIDPWTESEVYWDALQWLKHFAGAYMLGAWNDRCETTHAHILAMYDRAIEATK